MKRCADVMAANFKLAVDENDSLKLQLEAARNALEAIPRMPCMQKSGHKAVDKDLLDVVGIAMDGLRASEVPQ